VWFRNNQRWLQASKEGTEASKKLKSGSFKDESVQKGSVARSALKIWISKEWGDLRRAFWSTYFLLREGLSREEIGKWLRNKSIPWQLRRRLLQVVTGTFPCGQQLVKYGYKERQSAHCVKRHMKRMEAAGKESCQRKQLAIFKVQDA
jgi:hypothetical protein